ncbi:hypothetical protein HF521_019100 [Silurus meridionalis]|uniref:B box-type domain-containing protein n=1 Tax=Silurus meridionalis TaxID=175797 RepID=A0A8T0BK18_SILME|nr:hypothetical protein HF521_019100 [Silurus meridionalis]
MDENTAKPVDLSSAADLDVCTERKRKATSFCEDHKDQHGVLEKRQKMMTATKSLKRSLCPRHGKLMELFCRKDQQCICNLCLTYKHNNHDVVLIKDEVPEKKIKLEKMQMQTTKLIQTREKQEQALKRAIHSFETSAVRAVKENDKSFTELIRSIDKKQRAVKELITAQEEAVLKQVNALSERMEREISDLKSIDAKLQLRLSQADNDIGFLQTASIPHLPKSIQIPALVVHPSGPFQLITNDASNLIKQLRLLCQWRFMTISERVKNTGIISTPLPQTYQELLKYAFKLTLDTNTVHDLLKLSNLNKELTAVEKPECRPSHRDRFERRLQVLCREGLRGAPHYWEVECGRKRKAEQSCLQSLASYCVDHLDMHNVLHLNAKRHKLVGATGRFEERLCPEHDKLMELELGSIKKDINDRIKTRQRETKELKQATEAFQTSARQAVEDNENSFTELIHSIETRQREVKELILAREKAAVEKAKEFLERLPSEICDLKRGIRILSTPALTSSLPSPVLFVRPYSSFDLASEAVLDLVNRLRHVCNLHFTAISKHVKAAKILTSPPVFTKRDDFMQSASKLTMNLDTAHVSLHLSQNNTQVTAVHPSQHYPEHQDRFDCRAQILCKESLRGHKVKS